MCQVQVVYTPGRLVLSSAAPLPLTKKNQLEAEALALRIPQIARVIPPLRAKLRMREMIPRKLVAVSRERVPIVESLAIGGRRVHRWRLRKRDQQCKPDGNSQKS